MPIAADLAAARSAAAIARRRPCGATGCQARAAAGSPWCSGHAPTGRLEGPPEVECRRCRAAIAPTQLGRHFCSRRCSLLASNAKPYRKVANRRFPRVRYADRRAVLERDGWRCGICGAVIDPRLAWPHPGSAVIDHRDPRGPHEPANWQAAHNACNVEKGARAA